MANQPQALRFSRVWTDAADFPTVETSEMQVREDLQCLHDETRDYINNHLLPAVGGLQESVSGMEDAVEGKQDALTFDAAPTAGSANPVTSAGIKAYVDSHSGGGGGVTVDGEMDGQSENPVQNKAIFARLDPLYNTRGAGPGSIVTFSDGIAGAPLQSCVVNIEPAQAGSEDPSPENVRPITGWTGATVTVSPTRDAQDGTVYNISFGSAGTVYGGTLDVARGVLRSRPYYAAYAGETLVGPWISDRDVYAEGAVPTAGAQVVDLGGTEAEYTLAPRDITTLPGTNNIWADCGDVTVTYRGDVPNLYALYHAHGTRLDAAESSLAATEGSIAPVEASTTATRNYSVGDYLIIGGMLYRVTAAIASGGTITAGTNVVAATVASVAKQNTVRAGTVALSSSWSGTDPFSQTVTVSGAEVTGNSKVDLQPGAAAITAMLADGVNALYIENSGGTLTAWAVGGPPTAMTVQCTVTEIG